MMHASTRTTDPTAETMHFHPMIVLGDGRCLVLYRVSYKSEDFAASIAQKKIDAMIAYAKKNGWEEL